MQIRARRLAKLGSAAPKPAEGGASSSSAAGSAAPPASQPQGSDNSRAKAVGSPSQMPSRPSQDASSNPFAQLGVQGSRRPQEPGTLSLQRKRAASGADDGREAPPPPPPTRKPNAPAPLESDEDYAHRILSHIFLITVDPHHMVSSQGQRLAFVPGLNQELNDAGEPLKLSVSQLEPAIIEACTNLPPVRPVFDYLLACWKRAVRSANVAKAGSPARALVHDEAKRLCMSNALFSLTMPVLYG